MAQPEETSPPARLLKGLMLRTGAGPLGRVWALLYAVLIRAVAAHLRPANRDASVYVARSFALGDAVYGLSDVDLAVVADDAATQERIRARWQRLRRRLPILGRTFEVYVHERGALAESVRSSIIDFDLQRAGPELPRGAFLGARLGGPEWWIHRRPGLFEPLGDWRLVAGPGGLPRRAAYDAQERRVAAWLELVVWWSYAFFACRRVGSHRSPYLSAKLVTEAARVWLWLAGASSTWEPRETVLATAARLLPEEEPALRRALELRRRPATGAGDPLAELLPAFVRLTARVGRQIASEVESAGRVPVRLVRDGPELALTPRATEGLRPLAGDEPSLLPLSDWQGIAWPGLPDETFVVLPLDPGEPEIVAAAAEAAALGSYAALAADGVYVVPNRDWGALRSIQCEASDPVTFALADGKQHAHFPEVRGWSARDTARRAVAEHRRWLHSATLDGETGAPAWPHPVGDRPLPPLSGLGWLLTAARAASFLGSVEAGEPELALTMATAARRMGVAIAEEAYESYRACRLDGTEPPPATIAAFYELVRGLPAYA